MRAMRAESFTGYGALKLVEVPRPTTWATDRSRGSTKGEAELTDFRCEETAIPTLAAGSFCLRCNASPSRMADVRALGRHGLSRA
jgi:hypothetical protein